MFGPGVQGGGPGSVLQEAKQKKIGSWSISDLL